MQEKTNNTLLFDAIEFATQAHRGQFRKGTRIPYIIHPLNVARILLDAGCDMEIAAAGLLHDVLEDTPTDIDTIRQRFGDRIATLVLGSSEPDRTESWENRKSHTLQQLTTASPDILMVVAADKLDNIHSIHHDLERNGEQVWDRFSRPRIRQRWYYRSLADIFDRRTNGGPLQSIAPLFRHYVDQVFPESGTN